MGTIKTTHIWRLSNSFLNNQQIKEEIENEIKICLETNENSTTQNLWGLLKAVLRVHSNTSLPQETRETTNKQTNLTHKATRRKRKKEPQS